MKTALRFRAVIFDLDGLVLDSEAGYFVAWQKAAAKMGHGLSQAFCESLSGLHGPAISQRLIEHCGAAFDLDAFALLSREIWLDHVRTQGIPVKKGFDDLLVCIRDRSIPYVLATNSRRCDAEQCLAWAGLEDVFAVTVCRDDVTHPKPAPDLFIQASERLGIANSECLVLEDSPTGIAAAVAAASPCIYVPSCRPADPMAVQQANLLLPDLLQVADFISARFDHPL